MTICYRLDDTRLFAKPETREDAVLLNKIGKWFDPQVDPDAYSKWLHDPDEKQLPGNYVRETCTTKEFIKPYLDKLRRWTGYEKFNKNWTLFSLIQPQHTHVIDSAVLRQGDGEAYLYVSGYAELYPHANEPLDGKEVRKRASEYYRECVEESLGHRPFVPEFIRLRNGLYRPNPDYGHKRLPPEPGIRYADEPREALWAELWNYWLETAANAAQKRACAAVLTWEGGPRKNGPQICDYNLYVRDPAGPVDYDGEGTQAFVYRPEDFAKLGKKALSDDVEAGIKT